MQIFDTSNDTNNPHRLYHLPNNRAGQRLAILNVSARPSQRAEKVILHQLQVASVKHPFPGFLARLGHFLSRYWADFAHSWCIDIPKPSSLKMYLLYKLCSNFFFSWVTLRINQN
jgi:hypothetical protein